MIKSYKVKLKPTEEQEIQMWKFAGSCRFIYNWTINFQKERYEAKEKFVPAKGMSKFITELKKKEETIWLKEADSIAIVGAYTDACKSFENFFRERKKGNINHGYPRYKSKRNSTPAFLTNYQSIKITKDTVKLAKIGEVELARTGYIPLVPKYSNPRITFDGVDWNISVGVEEDDVTFELTDISLGIDLGIKDLAICSDGTVYKNINKTQTIKKLEKRKKRLQRKYSRKLISMNGKGNFEKGEIPIVSNNMKKLKIEINKLEKRITAIRQDYRHNVTTDIVRKNPCKIVIEDLNIKGMMKNKHLSDAIGNQGLYEVTRQLEYKAKYRGIELVKADRWFASSKTCSNCGSIKKDLKLKDRVFICDVCGFKIDRDLNASINLSNYKLVE